MQIVVSTLLLLASCGLTAAEGQLSRFTSNLAYRSPSLNHQALEVNLVDVDAKHAKLRKRNNGGDNYWQGNVSFPYGIASGVSNIAHISCMNLTRSRILLTMSVYPFWVARSVS